MWNLFKSILHFKVNRLFELDLIIEYLICILDVSIERKLKNSHDYAFDRRALCLS